MSGEEFDWWFDGNPAGSLRSVAVMDDRVVAVGGALPVRRGARGRAANRELLRARRDRPFGARPRHLRRAGTQARAGGAGDGRGLRAGLRQRAHGAALPRTARVDGDREAPRVGAAGVGNCRSAAYVGRQQRWRRGRSGRTTSSATANTCRWRYLDSPRGYEAVRHRRRLRGRLAGEATQGADDRRGRRPRRPDRACCPRHDSERRRGCSSRCRRPSSGARNSRQASCPRRRR